MTTEPLVANCTETAQLLKWAEEIWIDTGHPSAAYLHAALAEPAPKRQLSEKELEDSYNAAVYGEPVGPEEAPSEAIRMHDETEVTRTVVCKQRAYDVPLDVAAELYDLRSREGYVDRPSWVAVTEQLPEREKWVLVTNGKWTGVGGYMYEENDSECWQSETHEFIEHLGPKVTHWMELPAAPEAKP